MPILQTLYPFGLAAANIAMGWLLYGVLNATLGVMLAPVGMIIVLAVGYETIRPTSCHTRTVPHRLTRQSSSESPSETIR